MRPAHKLAAARRWFASITRSTPPWRGPRPCTTNCWRGECKSLRADVVNVHVFATDYDGTIAERNTVSDTTARALERVRSSGRKLLLVTGRMLADLQRACPEVDRMFDA